MLRFLSCSSLLLRLQAIFSSRQDKMELFERQLHEVDSDFYPTNRKDIHQSVEIPNET